MINVWRRREVKKERRHEEEEEQETDKSGRRNKIPELYVKIDNKESERR